MIRVIGLYVAKHLGVCFQLNFFFLDARLAKSFCHREEKDAKDGQEIKVRGTGVKYSLLLLLLLLSFSSYSATAAYPALIDDHGGRAEEPI